MLAVQQWKSARACLAEAAQAFLSACHILDESISGISDDPHIREEMILDIYLKRSTVESIRNSLGHSYSIVNWISNMSTKCVPVNTLPPETMTQIFSFATVSSICTLEPESDPVDTLTAITHVCSRWRQIAIMTGSLWSHIDIILDLRQDRYEQHKFKKAKLWLERARAVPVHLHVLGYPSTADELVSEAVSIIASYSPNIRSITLAEGCNHTLVESLLSRCALLSQPGLPDSVYLLQTTNTIHEQILELPIGQFRGLVHLRITSCPLNLDQFLEVLSNNASLSSLHLRDAYVSSVAAERYRLLQIALPYLEMLDLVGAGGTALSAFLSSLSLGPHFVEIRLGIPENTDFFEIIRSFAQRTSPSSVYLQLTESDCSQALPLLISLFPSIRALFIGIHSTWDDPLDLSTLAMPIDDRLTAHSQQLHTIGLINSIVNTPIVAQIAQLPGSGAQRQILIVDCTFVGLDLSDNQLAPLLAPSLTRVFFQPRFWSESETWYSFALTSATKRVR